MREPGRYEPLREAQRQDSGHQFDNVSREIVAARSVEPEQRVEEQREPEVQPQNEVALTPDERIELQNLEFKEGVLERLKDGRIDTHQAAYEINRFENDMSRLDNGNNAAPSRNEQAQERQLEFVKDRNSREQEAPRQTQSSPGEKTLTFAKDRNAGLWLGL
ncbi:MAG: hypothetical protein EPO08_11480 [Rhodospirillaceae bacterium]|nr:MAG: hypothetical protein EPO08_11480 [Rhodospirillaceae bacterium]